MNKRDLMKQAVRFFAEEQNKGCLPRMVDNSSVDLWKHFDGVEMNLVGTAVYGAIGSGFLVGSWDQDRIVHKGVLLPVLILAVTLEGEKFAYSTSDSSIGA